MSSAPTTTALAKYEAIEIKHKNNAIFNEITLDSLPYIDNLHPDYEAYALTLIEEEMENMGDPPSEDTQLRHLTNPLGSTGNADATPAFKSSGLHSNLNRTEYERLVARHGQPRTDAVDYREKMRSTKPNDQDNEKEWNEAINRAKAELEYERLRMVNSELQSEYESSLWKHQTKQLEMISYNLKSELSHQQMKVDQINARRKDMQTGKAAPKLHILSQKWDEGLNRVKLLSEGVEKLNEEVEELRKVTGLSFQNEEISQDDDDDL